MKSLTQAAKLWQQWWLNRKRLEIQLLEAEFTLAPYSEDSLSADAAVELSIFFSQ